MNATHLGAARERLAHPLAWLGTRDRGLLALRRAGRSAIVMPGMFALGDKVLHNPQLATFAAFGAFSMLLLVDFGGPMRERLQAQAALAVLGAVFVCLGTLASANPWLAAAAMAVVGFGVLFTGVISSVMAGATTAMLLAFILPVSLPGPASAIPDRLAGWGLAALAALAAVSLLWPAPAEDRLRGQAAATSRALAGRLRAEVTLMLAGRELVVEGAPSGNGSGPVSADNGVGGASGSANGTGNGSANGTVGTGTGINTSDDGETAYDSTAADRTVFAEAHAQAVQEADAQVAALHRLFLATPYRPTGLGTTARSIIRLVDELQWLNTIFVPPRPDAAARVSNAACAVKVAAAAVLDLGAELLDLHTTDREPLHAALGRLHEALVRLERETTLKFPDRPRPAQEGSLMVEQRVASVVGTLDPSFRAQELSFVASLVGRNIDSAVAAEHRSWTDRVLGRRPEGLAVPGSLSAAQERAAAHIEPHSVWLRNSVRGAIGLGLAVLIADKTGVQHSFWVVLGTLSVLRSNALNTGQNALRAVLGTAAGFAIGAALLVPIGTHTTLLWFLLPLAILVAGIAPAAISFAAGQAGFTIVLVILFNIIAPAGWRVGLIRVEDIALGCAVSVVVGLLFWPRGAAAALGKALAEAYTDSAHYLAAAVEFGVNRCDSCGEERAAPTREAARAAAAARRMDDTFRGFLTERGTKTLPLSQVTRLVTGVAGLRLAADAVLDLWARDDRRAPGDRTAARVELLQSSAALMEWYDALAQGLNGGPDVPAPQARDLRADGRLFQAVGRDLRGEDGQATATAVRMIWTVDHLNAARRLEAGIMDPALAVAQRRRAAMSGTWPRPLVRKESRTAAEAG